MAEGKAGISSFFYVLIVLCIFQLVNGSANRIAMSRALGAAFLHHQVEQLEMTVSSSGPTSGNWRNRKASTPTNGSLASRRRGPTSPDGKAAQRKWASERTTAKVKEFDRSISSSPAAGIRSAEQEQWTKDADIVVVDGSVLIHALYQVKKWCREGREEVIIVPLEGVSISDAIYRFQLIFLKALNTLDLLKKGTSGLSQKARAASRVLEAQVGTNPRIRVQRDEAFVLWDRVKFDSPSINPNSCPEWVRRIICCVQWEAEHPEEELKPADWGTTPSEGDKSPKVVLAVLSPSPASSLQSGSVCLSAESPVPLPAPNSSQATRHESRSTGSIVTIWASNAGIPVLDIEPALPERLGGIDEDDRARRAKGKRPSAGEHVSKSSLVERPPAVKAMMDMVSQPTKVIRVLARGEKLDP